MNFKLFQNFPGSIATALPRFLRLCQLGGSVEGDGVGWCGGGGGGTGKFLGLCGGGDGGNDCSGGSEAPRTVSARLILRL